jgi:hypothetical protein
VDGLERSAWLGSRALMMCTQLQQTVNASARVTLAQEIRAQSRVRCLVTDQSVKDSLTRYIDTLQYDYERISGQRLTEPLCVPGA